jgi:sodium-dependent dicarboxylate transporter 2/3/5
LDRKDLNSVDWATLALIAGGITLGNLLEQSGLVKTAAASVPWATLHPFMRLLLLCFASAFMSALMSNTATATMLIPLAGSLDPNPSTTVLIAIAASMGVPFVISTPPNAMVYGEGVKSRDLLFPGLILMILGCILITLTGSYVLGLMGIR